MLVLVFFFLNLDLFYEILDSQAIINDASNY